VFNQKEKKVARATITKHILGCLRPGYPKYKERRNILKKNLGRMGCAMLFNLPWRYANKKMIKEIVARKSTSFPATIREKSKEWDAETVSLSWLLRAEGKGLPPKKENLAKDYVLAIPSSKDRWKSSQCNHQELTEVLEFLVPLINLNKPKWMTIQVASAVVDCLINKTKISWAKVFKQSIQAQVEKLPIVPVTYLAAYCLNLYQANELLTKTEKKAWKDLKSRA
jgi:hypothetical protein